MPLFGTDGIRARAGEGPLAPDKVRRLGRVLGQLLRLNPVLFHTPVPEAFKALHPAGAGRNGAGDSVLIARDTRRSGPDIEAQLRGGLSEAGVPTADVGVLTTPGAAQLTRLWGCPLGIVISASHNPSEDNGIKLLSPQGLKVPDAAERTIEKHVLDPGFECVPGAATPQMQNPSTAEYLRLLSDTVEADISLKGLRIVLDCAHGATTPYAPALFKTLGLDVTAINTQPDGDNINRNCGAVHPEMLAAEIARRGADLGAAFDGDGDRAILVDEKGSIVDGDPLLAMHAIDLKSRSRLPEQTVVSTIMANVGLERSLQKHGIRLVRVAVGDRYVSEELLRSGARIGGEQSGHLIFFDHAPAGDGMLTVLRTLSLMRRSNRTLSDLASVFRRFPQVLLNIPVASKPPLESLPEVSRALAETERALAGEGRVVLRYSGTESLCRVMVEGPEEGPVRMFAERIAESVRRSLGNIP